MSQDRAVFSQKERCKHLAPAGRRGGRTGLSSQLDLFVCDHVDHPCQRLTFVDRVGDHPLQRAPSLIAATVFSSASPYVPAWNLSSKDDLVVSQVSSTSISSPSDARFGSLIVRLEQASQSHRHRLLAVDGPEHEPADHPACVLPVT